MFERRLDGLANLQQVDTPVGALEANVRNMKESLRLLELRVVGGGLTIGPTTFQSFKELAIWTKTGIPPGPFGLMVDGHSLLEFFSLSLVILMWKLMRRVYTVHRKRDSKQC
jgi:hypothetical protein